MKQPEYRLSRALHWLGWDRREPSAAAMFADEAMWLIAVRDRPVRVTACATVSLAPGVVRKGDLRLVTIGADALEALRHELVLPPESPLTIVVNPSQASADPMADTVRARVDKHQVDALAHCAQLAGFDHVRFDPRPAAAARMARFGRETVDSPLYVGGGGWLSVSAGSIRDVVAGGSVYDPTSAGSAPSAMMRIARPDPIRVAHGVDLTGPWPLLVGAALSCFGHGPAGQVASRDHRQTFDWAQADVQRAAR